MRGAKFLVTFLILISSGCSIALPVKTGWTDIDTTDPIAQTASANDKLTQSAILSSTVSVSGSTPDVSPSNDGVSVATQSPFVTRTPIPSLLPTVTETSSATSIPNCATRNKPRLPCFWKVLLGNAQENLSGDTFFSVADRAYGDYVYSLLILNFNRDEMGYQARLGVGAGRKDFLYLPPTSATSNPLEPFFPSSYSECDEFNATQKKPCLYLGQEGDTYLEIAQRFYAYTADAEICIRSANFLIDVSTNIFKLLEETDGLAGRVLILPILSDTYC